MCFSFSFSARSAYEARSKLHDIHAPAVVKALIEKALDAIPAPAPLTQAVPVAQNSIAGSTSRPKDTLIGVFVEVWGHLADAGDMGTSEIQRFIVKPLFD